jgi:hypothetical protein
LQRELELADAAAELGVPAKSLRALEWDRPDLVGGFGEADRITRRYAALLGLEVEEPAAEAAAAAAPAAVAAPRPRLRRRRVVWLPLLAALAPVAVIGVVYLLGKTGDGESAGSADREPRASSIVTNPDPGVSVAPAQQPPEPPPAASPREPRVNLVLTADRGGSWVEAHSDSATGPLLFQGTLETGRELRLAASRIWLRLGAASNVSLALNGRTTPRELFGTVDVLITPKGIEPA